MQSKLFSFSTHYFHTTEARMNRTISVCRWRFNFSIHWPNSIAQLTETYLDLELEWWRRRLSYPDDDDDLDLDNFFSFDLVTSLDRGALGCGDSSWGERERDLDSLDRFCKSKNCKLVCTATVQPDSLSSKTLHNLYNIVVYYIKNDYP